MDTTTRLYPCIFLKGNDIMKNQIFNTAKLNKMNELSGVESKLRLAVEAAEKISNRANAALELLAECNKELTSDGGYSTCQPKIIKYEESMRTELVDMLEAIYFVYNNYYASYATHNVQDFIQHLECEAIYAKLNTCSTPIVRPDIMAKPCDELFTTATDMIIHFYTISNDNNPRYYNDGKFVNPNTFEDIDFADYLIDHIETIGDLAYWIIWDHEDMRKSMIEDDNDNDVKVFKAICGALDIICCTHFFTDTIFGK